MSLTQEADTTTMMLSSRASMAARAMLRPSATVLRRSVHDAMNKPAYRLVLIRCVLVLGGYLFLFSSHARASTWSSPAAPFLIHASIPFDHTISHGESEWNRENRFTGWYDVQLSEKGASRCALLCRSINRGGRPAVISACPITSSQPTHSQASRRPRRAAGCSRRRASPSTRPTPPSCAAPSRPAGSCSRRQVEARRPRPVTRSTTPSASFN